MKASRPVRCFGVLLLALTVHCKTPATSDDSDVLVTNGLPVEADDHQAVVMLVMDDGACTGTFVSDYQVLTAAHCVLGSKEVKIGERRFMSPLFGYKTIATAVGWHAHPLFKTEMDARYDLAVVEFPKGMQPFAASLRSEGPRLAETVTIVGYGHNEVRRQMLNGEIVQSGADLKRMGQNKIAEIKNGELRFLGVLSEREAQALGQGPGQRAMSSLGDSGGPMFDRRGALIGVASGVQIVPDRSGKILTYWSIYCDVSTDSSRQFLEQHGVVAPAVSPSPS